MRIKQGRCNEYGLKITEWYPRYGLKRRKRPVKRCQDDVSKVWRRSGEKRETSGGSKTRLTSEDNLT